MKAVLKWLGGVAVLMLVTLALLAAHTWYFKPLRFSWFVNRAMLQHALQDPELLTSLRLLEPFGIDGHNARLTDVSVKHLEAQGEEWQQDLATLQAYNRKQLTVADQLAYDVMNSYIGLQAESRRWMFHDYPVNPLFGVQSDLPTLMATQQSVGSEHEAKQYLARLEAFGTRFDQLLEGLRLREQHGVIPPRFAVQKVLEQMRGFVGSPPEQNILYTSLQEQLVKAKSIDDDERGELLAEARERLTSVVYPAYDQLIAYFERLLIKAQADNGVWALPDGEAYYAFSARLHTTTNLTPEEIHQLGLAEVARIETEMDTILRSQGYSEGSIGQRMTALGNEPRFVYPKTEEGRAQCLADFQTIIDEITTGSAKAFSSMPKTRVEVRRVPEFKEKTSPQAYYDPPALDGSRPGVFWVNLRDVTELKKFSMRTLAYHEAVPGHHLQIAIALELKDVSTVQRVLPFTAYQEGWALYAERLAKELGFENDPFDDLGRLRDEQFRAVRLVVDSGLHYKHWTREQAIAYMIDKTGMPELDVITEIERYLVWPGQALAYKIGMLKILELRERAQQALGEKFQLTEFHDQVLLAGALPLDVLDDRVDQWIERTRVRK